MYIVPMTVKGNITCAWNGTAAPELASVCAFLSLFQGVKLRLKPVRSGAPWVHLCHPGIKDQKNNCRIPTTDGCVFYKESQWMIPSGQLDAWLKYSAMLHLCNTLHQSCNSLHQSCSSHTCSWILGSSMTVHLLCTWKVSGLIPALSC